MMVLYTRKKIEFYGDIKCNPLYIILKRTVQFSGGKKKKKKKGQQDACIQLWSSAKANFLQKLSSYVCFFPTKMLDVFKWRLTVWAYIQFASVSCPNVVKFDVLMARM